MKLSEADHLKDKCLLVGAKEGNPPCVVGWCRTGLGDVSDWYIVGSFARVDHESEVIGIFDESTDNPFGLVEPSKYSKPMTLTDCLRNRPGMYQRRKDIGVNERRRIHIFGDVNDPARRYMECICINFTIEDLAANDWERVEG